jgi:hypothetical protein
MKEKSKVERQAEKWLKENGFEYEIIKQYISKTIYHVLKEGREESLQLPMTVTNVKSYMNMFNRSFELGREIERMKHEKIL